MLTAVQERARRDLVGGSDASTIAGVNKYQQPLELYYIKRGEWPEADLSESAPVHFGNLYEDLVAEEWARRNERKVRRVNKTLVHPDLPFVGGHIDRKIEGAKEGLECKNRAWFMAREYGEPGTDEVMASDLVQSMHYMGVTGYDRWHVAVYFGGADFRMYTIERDDAFIADLFSLEAEFWARVEQGNAPGLDPEHATASDMLARLYPGTDGTKVQLPDEALHWHSVAQESKALVKQYQAVADGAGTHLRSLMGDAAVGLLPDGSGQGYTRKVTKRKGFEVAPTEFVDFRFSKSPRGVKEST